MNLSAETVADLKAWFQAIQTGWPGFVRRAQQDRMVAAIADMLQTAAGDDGESGNAIAIDAPTGVGKSMAYLVPGIAAVKRADGRKLLVSTATVALQSQLERDLQALAAIAPVKFGHRILKGRARYVCDRNLALLDGKDIAQANLGFADEPMEAWPFKPETEEVDLVAAMLTARVKGDGCWDGDLDSWSDHVPDRLVPLVTTTAPACAGQACRHYHRCPFVVARRGWDDADVLVVNHALLLADAALGGGAVLPDLSNCYLVVDEAHKLPEAAIEAASGKLVLAGYKKVVHEVEGILRKVEGLMRKQASPERAGKRGGAMVKITEGLEELDRMVQSRLPAQDSARTHRIRYGRVYGQPTQVDLSRGDVKQLQRLADLLGSAIEMKRQLERATEDLNKAVELGTVDAPVAGKMARLIGDGHGFVAAVEKCSGLLGRIAEGLPGAIWAERDGKGVVKVMAAPLDVSGWLAGAVWERAAAAVATSATLRSMGDFGHFVRRSGIDRVEGYRTLTVPSPFDLERAAMLRIPRLGVPPKEESRYMQAVLEELGRCVDAGEATLVLCASRAMMEALRDGLPPALRVISRMQGDRPLKALLKEHAEVVRAGDGSIMLGLATLAEGVDLPGDLCRHVVIVKVPFASPDDPVSRARDAWMQAQGRSVFGEVALPEAHRRLVQACGRLIRSVSDTGRITLLDDRLLDTAWGRRMVEHLPRYGRELVVGGSVGRVNSKECVG